MANLESQESIDVEMSSLLKHSSSPYLDHQSEPLIEVKDIKYAFDWKFLTRFIFILKLLYSKSASTLIITMIWLLIGLLQTWIVSLTGIS
jgi:hypothetical protein